MPRLFPIRLLALSLLVGLVAAGLVACGGGDDGEDPQQVLEQTFEQDKDYSSGILKIDLLVEGDASGIFDVKLDGPFQNAEGGFPSFDLVADVNIERGEQSFGFSGGLISTGDGAFVNFQDTDYAFDKQSFAVFKQLFLSVQRQGGQQEEGGSLINFTDFLTELENEGTEDVEGTETIHIAGRADAAKFVEAVRAVPGSGAALRNNPLAQQPELVTRSDFDVFTGKDDKRLRKLEADIAYNQPQGTSAGGDRSVSVKFTLTFADLGEPQTIAAPTNPRPVRELLQRYGGDLSGVLGGIGGSPAGGGDTGGGAGGGAAPTPTPPSDESTQEYLDCLSEAQGQEEVQACSEFLEE